MSEATEALARALSRLKGESGGLVQGKVLSSQPLRVLVEGNTQDETSLLRSDHMEPSELRAGDMVVVWPIEENQRYVILTRVVEL